MGKLFSDPVLLSNPHRLFVCAPGSSKQKSVESILAEGSFFSTCAPGEIDYSSADVEHFQTKNYRVRLFLTLHKEKRKAIILFALYCFPCKRAEKKAYHGRRESGSGGWRNAKRIMHNRKCEKKKEREAAAVS